MQTAKVGIREFRADLAGFIASSTPVAVTRHGQTVGYFIPTQGEQTNALAALHQAGQVLDALLASASVEVDEVVNEFKSQRRKASAAHPRQTGTT
jgi:antitoxin (DNA-binding transcriptional repressor) of toxin-antitoxin stability system